jgi:hypothetical protein
MADIMIGFLISYEEKLFKQKTVKPLTNKCSDLKKPNCDLIQITEAEHLSNL